MDTKLTYAVGYCSSDLTVASAFGVSPIFVNVYPAERATYDDDVVV